MADEAVVGAEGAIADEGAPESVSEPTEGATGVADTAGQPEPELFSVYVDGKEEKVTWDDMRNGHMRHADYTRKTQELAREREALAQQREQAANAILLAQALERDPKTTLLTIAQAAGVDLGTAAGIAAAATGGEQEPWDLVAQKVDGLQQSLTAQQQAAQRAAEDQARQAQFVHQIESEVASLQARHGEFDAQALLQYAVEHGGMQIEPAFKAWQYDLEQQRKADERNAAILAKRGAQVVEGGRNAAPGSTGAPTNQRMSIRDAALLALQQLNQ